ncbi:MAG: amidophosphoribosyltransferase [Archaeoglobaceae archaeon]|nr:amidophosphoribosyltransferase [Archaeoglobaceae archaeon]MDW7989304.1 amidophosphoribosyltransferase [Archaeoglobaceae archaeon]
MCGIAGAYSENSLAGKYVYYLLFSLQHRGQESAGIAFFEDKLEYKKGIGLVSEVFSEKDLLPAKIAVGHVRYSTTGTSKIENAQPFVVKSKAGTLVVSHNGNLVNYQTLRRELENQGSVFTTDTDSEVIAQLLSKLLVSKKDIESALSELSQKILGSYSCILILNDTLVAFRDPLGFRPICVGELSDGYVVCSESCAIDALDGELIKDLHPGEAILIQDGELEFIKFADCIRKSFCIFEYIYFARPDSIIDGVSVYKARTEMGKILAEESPADVEFVSAVPDSGITAAIGYAMRLGLPYMEALIKNRYVGRTFIMPKQELRELLVRMKVNVIKENVERKRIALIDDSIVRATTSKRIVEMLKKAEAKEVHFRVGSPPIIAPCYFGIDMKTRDELIASKNSLEEIREIVGADSLKYLSLQGLLSAVKKLGGKGFCIACLTSRYPVPVPGEIYLSEGVRQPEGQE